MTALLVSAHDRRPWKYLNDPEYTATDPLEVRAENLRASRRTKGQLWERVAEGKTR